MHHDDRGCPRKIRIGLVWSLIEIMQLEIAAIFASDGEPIGLEFIVGEAQVIRGGWLSV